MATTSEVVVLFEQLYRDTQQYREAYHNEWIQYVTTSTPACSVQWDNIPEPEVPYYLRLQEGL